MSSRRLRFYTAFTLGQTVTVVPLAPLGDRYDKRGVPLGVLVAAIVAYVPFAAVSSSVTFVSVRVPQGAAATGSGPMSLAPVGGLAKPKPRAHRQGQRRGSSRQFSGV